MFLFKWKRKDRYKHLKGYIKLAECTDLKNRTYDELLLNRISNLCRKLDPTILSAEQKAEQSRFYKEQEEARRQERKKHRRQKRQKRKEQKKLEQAKKLKKHQGRFDRLQRRIEKRQAKRGRRKGILKGPAKKKTNNQFISKEPFQESSENSGEPENSKSKTRLERKKEKGKLRKKKLKHVKKRAAEPVIPKPKKPQKPAPIEPTFQFAYVPQYKNHTPSKFAVLPPKTDLLSEQTKDELSQRIYYAICGLNWNIDLANPDHLGSDSRHSADHQRIIAAHTWIYSDIAEWLDKLIKGFPDGRCSFDDLNKIRSKIKEKAFEYANTENSPGNIIATINGILKHFDYASRGRIVTIRPCGDVLHFNPILGYKVIDKDEIKQSGMKDLVEFIMKVRQNTRLLKNEFRGRFSNRFRRVDWDETRIECHMETFKYVDIIQKTDVDIYLGAGRVGEGGNSALLWIGGNRGGNFPDGMAIGEFLLKELVSHGGKGKRFFAECLLEEIQHIVFNTALHGKHSSEEFLGRKVTWDYETAAAWQMQIDEEMLSQGKGIQKGIVTFVEHDPEFGRECADYCTEGKKNFLFSR